MQCSPTTRSSGPHSTSLSAVLTFALSALKAYAIAPKRDCLTLIASSPYSSRAFGSVRPIVPMGGCEKTTVGMFS